MALPQVFLKKSVLRSESMPKGSSSADDRARTQPHPDLAIRASDAYAAVVLKALASEPRLRILEALSDRLLNVSELAEALDSPLSTVTMHVNVLEEAGLLRAEVRPGERGLQKVCQRVYDTIRLELPVPPDAPEPSAVEVSMPVGAYVGAEVVPTCGIAGPETLIGLADDPAAFFEPNHHEAQLIWFRHGWLDYRFPNRLPPRTRAESLRLSMEICSEAPMHHHDWPSDITLAINGVEVGVWTSPADFGGRRGALTPSWWDTRNTQYGLLKEWRVTDEGSFVDGVRISDTTIDDLALTEPVIAVRLGVDPEARNVGGLNLFGRGFGNYPQDMSLRIRYRLDDRVER